MAMDFIDYYYDEFDEDDDDLHPFWKLTLVSAVLVLGALAVIVPISLMIWLLSYLCPV